MKKTIKTIKTDYYLVGKIIKLYRQCNRDILHDGHNWYFKANRLSRRMARKTGYSYDIVAAIIAILSPAVSWSDNKHQAYNMLLAYKSSQSVAGLTLTTYRKQINKALNLLKNPVYLRVFPGHTIFEKKVFGNRGIKTLAFYHNIKNPYDKTYVTIDTHIYNALSIHVWKKRITNYKRIQKSFIIAAEKLDILPCQLQACLWIQERELPF